MPRLHHDPDPSIIRTCFATGTGLARLVARPALRDSRDDAARWMVRRCISTGGRIGHVNGHRELPIRGHLFSPLVATKLPTGQGL